jgi:hypothetical protein
LAVEADDLWLESYRGEELGEALFGMLAEREEDPGRRRQLEALRLLEQRTKELAGPVLERRDLDRPDAGAARAEAEAAAGAVAGMPWAEFLGSFQPVIGEFLAKYRRLVELSDDETEREVAQAYVAHEQALEAFVRRAVGQEAGEPLQPILDLPHVAAASSP